MLIKLAWKNVWRNHLRSAVVITAIALGLWAGTFISGFSWGMYDQRIREAINNEVSHVQFHHPSFGEELRSDLSIPGASGMLAQLKKDPEVKAVSGRTITMAMAASARANGGVKVVGVVSGDERKVTDLGSKIKEGKYLSDEGRNPVVIGAQLAKKLHLRLLSKVVLTFQNAQGDLVSAAFRVVGIYESANSKYDELHLFVRQSDLQTLLGVEAAVHEIAVVLKDHRRVTEWSALQQKQHPKLLVQWWGEIMPELQMAIETFDQIMGIVIFIILLGLAFGIINTMQMAVLERIKELGMLMAVGMSRPRIFGMIMLETAMLMLVGAPLGLALGWLSISLSGSYGIDLSLYAEGLASYGFNPVIYPSLEWPKYLNILTQVIVVTVVAALIPARRALRLNPVDAIRTA